MTTMLLLRWRARRLDALQAGRWRLPRPPGRA